MLETMHDNDFSEYIRNIIFSTDAEFVRRAGPSVSRSANNILIICIESKQICTLSIPRYIENTERVSRHFHVTTVDERETRRSRGG